MLSQLFHNSAVLIASGPRGSYREARSSFARWKYYHELRAAFKLARAVGLIKHKYLAREGQSVNSKVGENLVKLKKVVMALEALRNEGRILGIRNGKIVYPRKWPDLTRDVTHKDVVEVLFDRLNKIKGFGSINEEAAMKNLQSKGIWDMLVCEGGDSFLERTGHFMGTWGLYSFLLNRLSIDMAAGRLLYQHKRGDALRVSSTYPVIIPDPMWAAAEKEAREKNIEEIKFALQADNPKEIPPLPRLEGEEKTGHTFVISDVHLREYLHENTEELLRFIYMIKRLDGRLVINGDFFDVWRAGGLDRAWTSNTRVVNALTKLREVLLVVGNHDEFLAKLAYRGGIFANPKLKVVETFVSADKRIRILHGHQLDRFNRPGSWIGRWVTRAVTRGEMSTLQKIVQAVNRMTAGAFFTVGRFLGFFFSAQFLARLLLVLRLFLPSSYVLKRQVKNISEWLQSEVENAYWGDGIKLSEENPMVFVIGHLHYEGISFLTEKVRDAVRADYGNKVKLIITDSWEGSESHVGDYVILLDRGIPGRHLLVRKEIWHRSRNGWHDGKEGSAGGV